MLFFKIVDKDIKPFDKDCVQILGPGNYMMGHILATGRNPFEIKYQPVIPESPDDHKETLEYEMWLRAQRQKEETSKKPQGRNVQIYRPKEISPSDQPKYERYGRAHDQSRLIMKGRKLRQTTKADPPYTPRLCIMPVDCITGPTIAVPNLQHILPKATGHKKAKKTTLILSESLDLSYMFVLSKSAWPRVMKQWVRKPT
jgi:hypothetical protein